MSTFADIANFQMSASYLASAERSFKPSQPLNFSAVKRCIHLGQGAISDNYGACSMYSYISKIEPETLKV